MLRISTSARIAVCGQAPGTRVHASGIPFSDPSGERLRAWMGIDAETFYDVARIAIVPMGLCFPGLDTKGGDLPPRRECVEEWHERVFGLLPKLELFLLVGQHAQRWHLPRAGLAPKSSLTATVEAWRDYWAAGGVRRCLPLPHPSWRNNGWIRRNPWFETDLLPHLRREIALRLA